MFERLITRPAALIRHRTGPLVEERLAYLHHLESQRYSLKSLRVAATTTLVVAHKLDLANRPGEAIAFSELTDHAQLWATRSPGGIHQKPGRSSREVFFRYGRGWLEFLGRLALPSESPKQFAPQITAFINYLQCERGLSSATIRGWRHMIEKGLERVVSTNGSLADLTITQVDDLLIGMVDRSHYSRSSVQTYATALRAFFRYAEACGWCRKGLAAGIETPRVYSQADLPTGPSWEQVQRLLAATAGNRPSDIRARAVLMLLAVYGLRAGDVKRLRLDDIDWVHETLHIHNSKNRQARTYPLARSVGDAILRYLQEVRPRSAHREVFLTLAAPYRPMHELWDIVGNRLRAMGLSIPRHGPHALRHACATHLMDQGLSLKQIGDHLGHRDPDATRIYAKVNLPALRQVAEVDLGGLA